MKTFLQWADERGHELPEVAMMKESGSAKRAGIRGAYPEGYIRSQYPDLYFTPTAADAPVQLANKNKWNAGGKF